MSQSHLFANLRARLLLLILCVLIPALAILIYNAIETRDRAIAQIQDNVLTASHLAADQQAQVVESARQVLLSLAQLPEVRNQDAVACSARLVDVVQQYHC